MAQIPATRGNPQASEIAVQTALPMVGSLSREDLQATLGLADAEIAKLFEDRNVMLQNGGIITFTGAQLQFTENLEIAVNQRISGAAPLVISLGSANVNLNNLEMWYAIIDRVAGTATTAVATSLPAVVAANKEVFLIVKRVDAGDGTQRAYFRNGMALNAGQSVRLGSSGSGGSGSGIGDDLGTLLYRASFRDNFDEGPSDSKSAVDITAGKTDANTFSAAKAMYVLNYDASKTVAAGTTTTTLNISATPTFTVKIGDVAVYGNVARRISAVTSQTSFTVDAFPSAPVVAAQVTISQAVHTKDVYNLPVDGNAISAAFTGETFSDILVDYEDTSAAGDNIFDVNVAPVVGFDASVNGTTFTSVQLRPTLEMTQIQSTTLPAAGTALYIRLFANKTSGSGIVNVLGYRAFMQKTAVVTAGGITNTAYGFTNGVGTPINAAFSVVGGKTVVTLGWQYPVGVYPNTTASSIEVWLNGSKLPRFVDATLTPDGSFVETATNIITLDRDYSAQNLSVEVFLRTQIVDASTQNTTAIAAQQEIMQNGFQPFVASNATLQSTTVSGTPAVGTFYSSIVNRASIVDITQDLKVSLGVDRVTVQQIFSIPTEYGPNGETVWGAVNDSANRIRFVGADWANFSNTYGTYVATGGTEATSYVEVTFYGTGLSVLTSIDAARTAVYSVDGGTESANFLPSGANVLAGRNYAPNQLIPVVSGLTLGTHTVKIRDSSATTSLLIFGFDILNQNTSLVVNPGIAYTQGKKNVTASQSLVAYNSGFESGSLGARGGRVVVYQKSNGIGKAAQSAGSQLNIAAADHSNEEVARIYHFREFGTGRADDFSTLGTTPSTRSFTLDDNSINLTFGSGNVSTVGNMDALFVANSNDMYFTFIGTGLDITNYTNTAPSTYTVSVDNTLIGSLPNTILNSWHTQKIVSGLPYGTHTVKFSRGAAGAGKGFGQFIIYQPKKPTVPIGCIELADYNVMANYVANTVLGAETIASGVLRKLNIREMTYVGSWTAPTISAPDLGGWNVGSTTVGDYVQYTFFGTGFEYRYTSGSSSTYQVLVNGSTNLNAYNTSSYGNVSAFTASTGIFTSNATGGIGHGVTVSNMPLGVYTVRITRTAGTSGYSPQAFDVITPIHSHKFNSSFDFQNTLSVGSQGISDNRTLTPVKEAISQSKNVSQAIGVTAGPTTTSTSLVPVPEMSALHTNRCGRIKISYSLSTVQSIGTSYNYFAIFVDGVQVTTEKTFQAFGNGSSGTVSDTVTIPVNPGVHKVDVYWRVASGTGTTGNRNLIVEEA